MTRAERAAGLLTFVLTGSLLLRPPTGTDTAAQQARASFAAHYPFTPVDLSWFGGVPPLSYSVLSPYVMAAVGVGLAGLLAAVVGSVLLTRLLRGGRRPWCTAVLGSLACTADIVSGRTTFALGLVAALAALLALPRRRWALLWALLTALLSPVAAVFLALAAAALVLCRRPGGWTVGLAATAPVLVVAAAFPAAGWQPYRFGDVRYPVLVAVALLLLARGRPVVRVGAGLYAAAVLGLLASQDQVGSNITRLAVLLSAPLLTALVAAPRVLLIPLLVVVLNWQSQPLRADLAATPGPETTTLVAALRVLRVHRVEVVPLRDHGEAAAVAAAVPLARGWSRQIDVQRNPLFYAPKLTAAALRSWLVEQAVEVVALAPQAPADPAGQQERALLLAGRVPGVAPVFQDRAWRVWRGPGARPLVDGPAQVETADRKALVLRASGAGSARVQVRWSRWLSVQGPACVMPDGDQVRLSLSGPGLVVLGSSFRPRGHCR